MEGKTNFFEAGAYRLLGTQIVECLEIIDVGCNLKQCDGLTLTSHILPQIYATEMKNQICVRNRNPTRHGTCSGRRKQPCVS